MKRTIELLEENMLHHGALIRVNTIDYVFKHMSRDEAEDREEDGYCFVEKCTIGLCVDMPPMRAADGLIHEILHAWLKEIHVTVDGSDKKYKEEDIIRPVATGIMKAIYQDNPNIAKFLNGCAGITIHTI